MAENESWVNQPQPSWPPTPINPQIPGGQSIIPPGGGGGNYASLKVGTETPPPPTTTTPVFPIPSIDYIDDCMRSVNISNINGFVVSAEVFVNGVSKGKVPFSGMGLASVMVPISGCLKIGDSLTATIVTANPYTGAETSTTTNPTIVESHEKNNVTTQHYNNARTGWFQYETQLTPNNIANIKEQFRLPVEQPLVQKDPVNGDTTLIPRNMIYAQPLYLHHQFFPRLGQNGEVHNAIYIASENTSVYAYDADTHDPKLNTDQPLWKRSVTSNNPLLPPGLTFVDDFTLIPQSDIKAPIGISSTPVIDCGCNCNCDNCGCGSSSDGGKTPTMYIVSKSQRGSGATATFHFYLHALDVTTGDDRPNSPVEITGQVNGTGYDTEPANGPITFQAQMQNCRPGLLLLNCTIYIAFAAHQDTDPYHGWIFSYDALTLKQKNIFCTSPDAITGVNSRAGIWQSGMGLATDGCSIFCTTGNGAFNADSGGNDFGTTVLKLSQDLRILSWFSPSNQADDNATNVDADLGSGGVLVLPEQQNSPLPLLVTAGKDGQIFLLNRNNLGGYDPTGSLGTNNNSVDTILIRDATMKNPAVKNTGENLSNPGLWGSPAYYEGLFGPVIFYCMNGSITGGTNTNGVPELVGFQLKTGKLIETKNLPAQLTNMVDQFPGGGSIPVISSSQKNTDTAILWVVQRTDTTTYPAGPNNLTLFAYKANDLSFNFPASPQLLKHPSTQYGTCPGLAFVEPTVINGKVYVPCDGHVSVFSL